MIPLPYRSRTTFFAFLQTPSNSLYSSIHASSVGGQLWSIHSIAMCFAHREIVVQCSCALQLLGSFYELFVVGVVWSYVCLCDIGLCGQCCVTRHEVSQLASGVSVGPTVKQTLLGAAACVYVCALLPLSFSPSLTAHQRARLNSMNEEP